MQDSHHVRYVHWIFGVKYCYLSIAPFAPQWEHVAKLRDARTTRHRLSPSSRCACLHFTLSLEAAAAAMRRETALGNTPHERQREIMSFITENGETLARVATSGLPLTDDLKARILSTFLTLMNLAREYRSGFDAVVVRTHLPLASPHLIA